MVSAGKYFVTGEFRVADDSKVAPFPGAHVEVVLAYEYEALGRRCRELEMDVERRERQRYVLCGDKDRLIDMCIEYNQRIESLLAEVERYKGISDNYYAQGVDKELENAKLRAEVEHLRKDSEIESVNGETYPENA